MLFDYKLELLRFHRLNKAVLNACLRASLDRRLCVIARDSHNHQLWQLWVTISQAPLLSQDPFCSLDTVHTRHDDISQYDPVPSITASLLHVLQIAQQGALTIASFVTLQSILLVKDLLNRGHIVDKIVHEQDASLRAAVIHFLAFVSA